ncbi:MAG: (d)CMP kinase [Mycoplasma sp.]|nr:(d)CMP kinase [Mycoplasma sp.]
MNKISIAIDGPAGSGKSTIARILANDLNLIYINTGLIYRSIAFFISQNNVDYKNINKIKELLETINIELKEKDIVILNGDDVTKNLRKSSVSKVASIIAQIKEIRNFATDYSRKIAKINNVVMDGRDVGTVIIPDSKVKIFLSATPEIRAKRRVEQNSLLGIEENYENILKSIIERDKSDMQREMSPLLKADDAIEIDSSNISIVDVVNKIKSILNSL